MPEGTRTEIDSGHVDINNNVNFVYHILRDYRARSAPAYFIRPRHVYQPADWIREEPDLQTGTALLRLPERNSP